MVSENSKPATGYPPVTEAESRQAAETAAAERPNGGSGRLGAQSKIIVDAMAGVVEEHRRRIDATGLDPAVERYALDLLDALFLDFLQIVLDEASALEVVRGCRRDRR